MVTFHHKQMRNMILPPKILLWPPVRILPFPEICSKTETVQHRPENPTECRFACSCQAKLSYSLQHQGGCYITHFWMSSGKQGQSCGCRAAYLTHTELFDSLSDPAELSNSLLSPQNDSGGPCAVWWGASIHPRSSWNWQKSSQLAVSDISLSYQTTTVHETRGVRFTFSVQWRTFHISIVMTKGGFFLTM